MRFRYGLNFSDQFNSIVVSYYDGEHELYTTLLNVDGNNKIIDQLEIAYDEIAESALRKSSTINKDKIIVEDWNFFREENQKITKTYFVTSEGKFRN